VLRWFGILVTLTVGVGGFLGLDYNLARKLATTEERPAPSFQQYLGELKVRTVSLISFRDPGDAAPDFTTKLAEMLPAPPKGWTVRTAVAEDIDEFLAKNRKDNDPQARKLIEYIGKPKAPDGIEAAVLTYEKGSQRIVIKAVRHPDDIFTEAGNLSRRADLQTAEPLFQRRDFLRVRGLDIAEEKLPEKMRGRLFVADVGAQIQMWVIAPKRMADKELIPFFETLQVNAMNAAVIDKEPGLGDVPVIVLVSALDDADRAAYEADRAARSAERANRRAKEREELAEAARAKADGQTTAKEAGDVACKKNSDGVKRCKVGG
jgi:hypothetical protein